MTRATTRQKLRARAKLRVRAQEKDSKIDIRELLLLIKVFGRVIGKFIKYGIYTRVMVRTVIKARAIVFDRASIASLSLPKLTNKKFWHKAH